LVLCVVVVALWAVLTPARPLVPSLALGCVLAALAFIDIASFRLPDALTLPLAAGGMALALIQGDEPLMHALGFLLGVASFWLVDFVYWRLRKRHGLGFGDAKLFGAGGAWLGAEALPQILMIGCAAAFVWVAFRLLVVGRETLSKPIPFGSALAVAIWAAWWTN
jgi:leader peptidase (prepilin peptidase)/N-methyltransferase